MIPGERELPESRLARRKAHLVSEIAVWKEQTARRGRRRIVIVVVPAVIVLLAVTGFTTYALTREPTHLESLGCFDRAALDANTTVVNTDGRDPTEICAELWRQGAMGDGPIPAELAACVLHTGAIGVFPSAGPGTCEELGLADLPASYAAEGKRFAELRNALTAKFGEPPSGTSRGNMRCVGEEEARAFVRQELDAHGHAAWKIEVGGDGYTAERPCTLLSFDGARKVVVLVPYWDERA
jgi:hypothetical protein